MSNTEDKATVEINTSTSLPFHEMKQSAILGHLINNSTFFLAAHQKIQPNWFRSPFHSKVYQNLLNLYKITGQIPTVAELKSWKDFNKEDPPTRIKLFNTIDKALADAVQIRLEAIKPELTEWLHSKILRDSMVVASKHWNKGRFSDAAVMLEGAVKEFHEAKFDEGEEITFDDHRHYLVQAEQERSDALTTGLTLLDRGLLDNGGIGGLQRGDTTLILAPSNAGKTTSLITTAVHNVSLGKHVLFLSHEGRPEDLRLKMLRCALGVTEKQLFDMYRTPEGMAKLDRVTQVLKTYLTYIPFNKAGMCVEDLMPVIRRVQEEKAAKNNGKGFDLLVDDYPAKMTTAMAQRGNLAVRHILEIVYEYFVQLGLEYKFHNLLAIQGNREASKVNRGDRSMDGGEQRLLTKEDVAEAWGPIQSATNVITANRSPAAEAGNWMTYYVSKSRSSQTGLAVVCRTNFGHSMTHSNKLGAFAYYGTHTMENSVEGLLSNHNGEILSWDMMPTGGQ